MAYIYRGRGPRTHGGCSRGESKGNMVPVYSRRDGDLFLCLSGHTQDGDDMTQQNFWTLALVKKCTLIALVILDHILTSSW